MVEGILRVMLGPLSPALDFIENNPFLIAVILLVWIALWVAGKLQLNYIEKKTSELVLTVGRQELSRKRHISPEALYKQVYPQWESALGTWGCWFILNHFELWPVPIKPATVKKRLAFTPEWIEKLLIKNNLNLSRKDQVN